MSLVLFANLNANNKVAIALRLFATTDLNLLESGLGQFDQTKSIASFEIGDSFDVADFDVARGARQTSMICNWLFNQPTNRLHWLVLLVVCQSSMTSFDSNVWGQGDDYYLDDPSASERSTIRQAINPATRRRSASSNAENRQVQLASDAQPFEEDIIAMPDVGADLVPSSEYQNSSGQRIVYGSTDPSVSDCGSSCGYGGCDDIDCGFSICNPGCGGTRPCLTFINPIVDPAGFTCSLVSRMQFRVASANFWTTSSTIPVLATSDTDVTLGTNGVALLTTDLEPGDSTSILYGGARLLSDSKAGVRADLTYWVDDCSERGLWLRLYNSGDHNMNASFDSQTNSILARPFNSITTGTLTPSTNLLTFPNERRGTLDISLRSVIQGGDLILRKRLSEDDLIRNDFLWGYQQVRFAEDLLIESTSTVLPTRTDSLPVGTKLELNDRFATANQFNGGQIGFMRSAHDGCWYFDGMAKVGFGQMNRTVQIEGFSQSTVPGSQANDSTDGLLARRSNNGVFEDRTFVFVPELSLSAAYLLTDSLHFTVGYTYLRLPKVTRVGDAIDSDLAVNLNSPLTGQVRPEFNFLESNANVHSLDLGLMYRY